MKALMHVQGPRDAGPGERQEMLERARGVFQQADVSEVVRVDVPPRGSDEEGLREVMRSLVPALQSPSLFGGRRGVLVVDAENLQRAEAEVLGELAADLDAEAVTVAFVSAGALPAPLAKAVR
ncbi:MAG: hypothetical protein ACRD02_11755, partial [Acidimicrobiia bacterium]